MIFKEAKKTSVVISLLRASGKFYSHLETKIAEFYHDSYTYCLVNYFFEKIRLSFKFSFFVGIFRPLAKGTHAIWYNSKVIQGVANTYKRIKSWIIDNLSTSQIGSWTTSIKKEHSLYSVRAASIVLILAVVVNLILSLIFPRQLSALILVMRWVILAMGILGLFCDVEWATLKSSSAILKVLLG
ncbi:MAG: hypothetical protein AMJ78_01810 [Omnitrophica WOR_2 bacterium SM23_29]|nr:MAG: hypothetical protein AMJ78_01810 [Omnitrophica WOR_2 bacterium SM23_29]